MPIDRDQLLSGEILHPVLFLSKKNLSMVIKDCRMVQYKTTVRIFPNCYRKLSKRLKRWAILNDQCHLNSLDGDLVCMPWFRLGVGRGRLLIPRDFGFSWRARRWWTHDLRFAFRHLRQKADLWSAFCKHQDIPVFKIGILHLFSIQKCPVSAVVQQSKTVAFSDDLSMFPGNNGYVFRELDMVGRISADGDRRFGELLDFTFQGSLDMNKLDDNGRHTFHLLNTFGLIVCLKPGALHPFTNATIKALTSSCLFGLWPKIEPPRSLAQLAERGMRSLLRFKSPAMRMVVDLGLIIAYVSVLMSRK
jgi:hypothetical protein